MIIIRRKIYKKKKIAEVEGEQASKYLKKMDEKG